MAKAKAKKVKKTEVIETAPKNGMSELVDNVPVITLSEVDKFYIKGKNGEGVPLEDIVSALGKPTDLVAAYIESLKKTEESPFEKALAKQTQHGKKPGIAMMTTAASQISDEVVKTTPKLPIKYNNCITKIKEKNG